MPNNSDSSRSSKQPTGKATAGNMLSPDQQLSAAAVAWQTEDLMNAQPYPMPEVTEETVRNFIEAFQAPSAKGGSSTPGGQPGSDEGEGEQEGPTVAGHAYPPPFNQHSASATSSSLLHDRQDLLQPEWWQLASLCCVGRKKCHLDCRALRSRRQQSG